MEAKKSPVSYYEPYANKIGLLDIPRKCGGGCRSLCHINSNQEQRVLIYESNLVFCTTASLVYIHFLEARHSQCVFLECVISVKE